MTEVCDVEVSTQDLERKAVADMIETLRDRLDDLEESFVAYSGPCEGYAQRLDKLDDELFGIESEFESYEAAASQAEDGTSELCRSGKANTGVQESATSVSRVSQAGARSVKPLSKEAQRVAQAKEDTKVVAKEGAALVSELAGAVKDIKEALKF